MIALISCGETTRTPDLKVMGLASYQLLHSAMSIYVFLKDECKGILFICINQIISVLFYKTQKKGFR